MIRLFGEGRYDSQERIVYVDRPQVVKEYVVKEGRKSRAIYAGSFDPIHNGHIDVITRAARIFDSLEVAVGMNPAKKYAFTLEERIAQVKEVLSAVPNITVNGFDGLLVRYAFRNGVRVIVKGVRNAEDYRLESMYHEVGATQDLGIETILIPARPGLAHISSTAVRLLQEDDGDIHSYVPLCIKQALEERISGRYLLGVTGQFGCGKSYVGEQFIRLGKELGIPVTNIELDVLGHDILGSQRYQDVKDAIIKEFGKDVLDGDKINRRALMDEIFRHKDGLEILGRIMLKPMMIELQEYLKGKKGLILINGALLAESSASYLCNNNVVLVQADDETRERRLLGKKVSRKQQDLINAAQYPFERKRDEILSANNRDHHGRIWIVPNSGKGNKDALRKTFVEILKETHIPCKT